MAVVADSLGSGKLEVILRFVRDCDVDICGTSSGDSGFLGRKVQGFPKRLQCLHESSSGIHLILR